MKIEEKKKLRKIINQGLKKAFSVSETDLIAKSGNDWAAKKEEFKTLIGNLLTNLENDDYDDAYGDIDKTISILQIWKKKISKEIADSTEN